MCILCYNTPTQRRAFRNTLLDKITIQPAHTERMNQMRTTKNMDYIYTDDEQAVLIEALQTNTRETIIRQFVQCRKGQKMTQADVARRTGIPRTNITRFESGRYNPSLEMMVKIAAALGMKVQLDLMTDHRIGEEQPV